MSAEPSFNPFPGLRPFRSGEEHLFFGREGQSEKILERLRRNRFLAVVGVSGSGKSSLIFAGLLPYLFGGFLPSAGSHWRTAVFRPGGDPIGNLARALNDPAVLGKPAASEEDAATREVRLQVRLRRSGLGLIETVRLARLPAQDNLLVVVDQFEELFRFAGVAAGPRSEDDAAAFVRLLLEAARQVEIPIYVVLTMRSDFIGDCARYRDLPEAVTAGLFLIPRMTREQRRAAIEEPVRVGGGTISRRLVNRLLNDLGDSPDQLPILQHALMRSWERWRKETRGERPIDLEDYLAIGAMREALSLHAEEAYGELPDGRPQDIARRLFQALTEKGADNREVRRPTKVATLAEAAEAQVSEIVEVVEVFRRPGRSFLMPPADVRLGPESAIDISHESLIRGWHRLAGWVEAESESARVYRRLAETAALHAERRAGLWHDPDLQYALAWRDRERPNAAWATRYHPGFAAAMAFLEASRLARDEAAAAEERRRTAELRQARQKFYGTAGALAVVVALAGFATWQRGEALRQKGLADANARRAELQTQVAVQQKEIADANARRAEDKAREAELASQDLLVEARRARAKSLMDSVSIAIWSDQAARRSSPVAALPARLVRSLALSSVGNHAGAIRELDTLLAADPENYDALVWRGYEYLLTGKTSEAARDAEKALSIAPRSDAFLNLAIGEVMRHDYDGAIAHVRKAVNAYVPPLLGMDSEVSPDIQRASHHTVIIYENAEFRVALHYEIATLYALKGDPGFAAALQEADRSNPAYPRMMDAYLVALNWAWLGSVWQETGLGGLPEDYGIYAAEGALWERVALTQPRYFDWARKAYDKFRNAHETRRDGRYDALSRWVAERLDQRELKDATPAAVGALGSAPDVQGLALQADELTARAARQEGESATSIASAHGKLGEAIDALEKVRVENGPGRTDLDDRLVVLLLRRAQMRLDVEDWHGAHNDAARVVALNPKVSEAYRLLAKADFDDGVRREHYEQAIRSDPANRDALRDFALFIQETDPEQALRLLERALHLSSISSIVSDSDYEQIARLQLKLGRHKDALASIRTAIATAPHRAPLYELRREIELAQGWSPAKADVHLAAGYRAAGDALAMTGQDAEALSNYVSGLEMAATLPQADEDARFEFEAAVRTLSEFLSSRYSDLYAQQFWQSLADGEMGEDHRERIRRELRRLAAGR